MSETPVITRSKTRSVILWIIRTVILGIIVVFFSAMMRTIVLVEFPIHFLLGWMFHSWEVLPPLLAKSHALALPLGCLVLAGVLAHRFIRSALAKNGSSRNWRPTDTFSSIVLVLLGCGAAIALSGVAHQVVWLMGDRWVRSNHRTEQTVAVNNARQLMFALMEFHDLHHRYPNSLHELDILSDLQSDILDRLIWVDVNDNRLEEPFILLHSGQERLSNPDEPVIVSPIIGSTGKFVVGYGDFSVRSLPASQFNKIVSLHGNQQPKHLGPDE